MTDVQFPPNDINAERAILASMILSGDAAAHAIEEVKVEEFYSPQHRKMYSSMQRLYSKGEPLDTITIKDDLEKQRELDDVGGLQFLMSLLDDASTGANIASHIGIVKDKAKRRRLLEAATRAVRESYDPTVDTESLCKRLETDSYEITSGETKQTCKPITEWVRESVSQLTYRQTNPTEVTGISTGYKDLDRLTLGLHPGEFTVIGARPSIGKSTLLFNLALNVAVGQSIPCIFFSLEMSGEMVAENMLCAYGHINKNKFRTGYLTSADHDRIIGEIAPKVYEGNVMIDDSASHTITSIQGKARHLIRQTGAKVIMVDYLQFIKTLSANVNREQQVSECSHGLKELAKSLKVCVVCACQLNRRPEERVDAEPKLCDLRDSGGIEQDADLVWLLHRKESEPGTLQVNVAKNRNGQTGRKRLKFIMDEGRIANEMEA